MVHDSLQISLIRTRDLKDDESVDSNDYNAPFMNSTRIEENKRSSSNYYDIPKLPSVSPIADQLRQLPNAKKNEENEREVHHPVLKEYKPLDKSFHLNALDDIEYYNEAGEDDEHD